MDIWCYRPGLIITILFFFDHEVSSIICTSERYGTKKPGGFSWDIVLLGCTTALCGILGIPPANGLLPQAPLHSESLMHNEQEACSLTQDEQEPEVRVVRRIYEQRWSAFLHAGAILVFVTPPFQHVLGLTPTSVLAGLFMYMGEQSLSTKCDCLLKNSMREMANLIAARFCTDSFIFSLHPPSYGRCLASFGATGPFTGIPRRRQ